MTNAPRHAPLDGRAPHSVAAGTLADSGARARPLRATSLIFVFTLAACATPQPQRATEVTPTGQALDVGYVPDFARKPYEPFGRANVVAIAMREWRLFGQGVDDDPPDTRPPPPPELKPEREPGLWQRVAEYWWIGLNSDSKTRYWTGKHDDFGYEFPAERDGEYAWSAAFVSYVMRIAGAGARFPYSESHATYINAAKRVAMGGGQGWVVTAERTSAYAPRQGDLICTGRDETRRIRYDDLPRGGFQSHCDIVVQVAPGQVTVVGGNVDDAVTVKHVPTTADGMLAGPGGTPIDTRYPWFVVLRVLYDAP